MLLIVFLCVCVFKLFLSSLSVLVGFTQLFCSCFLSPLCFQYFVLSLCVLKSKTASIKKKKLQPLLTIVPYFLKSAQFKTLIVIVLIVPGPALFVGMLRSLFLKSVKMQSNCERGSQMENRQQRKLPQKEGRARQIFTMTEKNGSGCIIPSHKPS